MTTNSQPGASAPSGSALKWAPWAGLGLLAAVMILLAAVGPGRLLAMLTPSFRADKPLSLTILHTNDTWGFVYPCG